MPLRLRTSTNRRNGTTYSYHQLVRAVRREGRPTHEVVAHLGQLSPAEASALRRGLHSLSFKQDADTSALDANLRVRLDDVLSLASLRYLDLMVVRSLWQEWRLTEFFEEHLGSGLREVSPADVVFVLVANRCVAPCSKLRVTEWAPRTCLPQLLGFDAAQLNNTRIHRVLEALEGIEPKLSRFLVEHAARRRPDSVVYLDLTSTWFEGHGGTLGQRNKSKDGAIRRHLVHLAMGVDARGLPLRWEVLPGKTAEVNVLPQWIDILAEHASLRDVPLVFDRGLTSEKNLLALVTHNRRFVTCARESQVERWDAAGIDCGLLARLPAGVLPTRATLESAGLNATRDDDIYHADLGVRPPVGMDALNARGLRVVPYFRPSLFLRNRDSLERVCRNVEGKVAAINEELRAAKRDRDAAVLDRKIDELLRAFQVPNEYSVRIEPHPIAGAKGRSVRSFQVHLDPVQTPSSRRLNGGWMVLLAHPDDRRPAIDLIRQYHSKEVVEHAFAVIKSFVDLRPIRHQTDLKIRAHVTLCVLALLLNRHLELKLRNTNIHDAIDRVYEMLEPCRLHILSDRARSATHPTLTEAHPEQLRLLEALGLTRLADPETAAAMLRRPERRASPLSPRPRSTPAA